MTSTSKTTTGTILFNVPGVDKECYTWYKVFGDLKTGTRPLIALHGGPGVGYILTFFRALSLLTSSYQHSISFTFYI